MTKQKAGTAPKAVYQSDVAARRENQVKGQRRMVIDHIRKHPGASWRDCAARYGWTTATAQRVCKRALELGDVNGSLNSMTFEGD